MMMTTTTRPGVNDVHSSDGWRSEDRLTAPPPPQHCAAGSVKVVITVAVRGCHANSEPTEGSVRNDVVQNDVGRPC